MPDRRVEACRGFKDEVGVRQRPGKSDRGLAAHNAEVNAGRRAGVEEHRHASAAGQVDCRARHGQVGLAVSVEVAHRHGIWMQPSTEVGGGSKCAVAVAQQHRDAGAGVIGEDEVELAIAVEVNHRQRFRTRIRVVVEGGLQGAVPFTQ